MPASDARGPEWFDKQDALLAIDGIMAQLIVLKKIITNTLGAGPVPERVCSVSKSGEHERIAWERDGSGMCRDCGATVAALDDDSGVSAQ